MTDGEWVDHTRHIPVQTYGRTRTTVRCASLIDEAEQELIDLAAGMDIDEMLTQSQQDANGDDNDNDNESQESGISAEARAKLNASTRPVKLVLVKVSPLHMLCVPNLTYCNGLS